MRATPFLCFTSSYDACYDCRYEVYHWTKETYTKSTLPIGWLWFTVVAVQTYNQSSKLPTQNTPTTLPRFKNVNFRQHYVMQKNSSCIENEQSYICRMLHFNRQNQMLKSPPKTIGYSLWHLLKLSRWTLKNSMRCHKKCFYIILVMAICGMPTPRKRFFPGQCRWTLLPKERHGDSLRGRELNHTIFQLRGGHSTTDLSPT